MERKDDLGRLENRVERLLLQYRELREEKERLETTVRQRDQEIDGLKAEIEGLQEDKATVHKRVGDLILSIEEWERENSVMTQMAMIPEKEKANSAEVS